jgi:hypothetical protein
MPECRDAAMSIAEPVDGARSTVPAATVEQPHNTAMPRCNGER